MKNHKLPVFLVVSLLCFVITWYCQSPKIFNEYAFTGDLTSNIYWMERARNPGMFKNDIIADFNYAFANPLLIWLYRVTDPIDIKLISELLAFPLCWIAVFFLFRLAYDIKGTLCAFFAGLLLILYVWHEYAFDYFGVGNAGDFVFPLTTAFAYYFYSKKTFAMAVVLLLQAFFYPPIFIICMFCFMWMILKKFQKKEVCIFLIVTLVSLPIIFSAQNRLSEKFGEPYNLNEIKEMAEFRDDGMTQGRIPLFYSNILDRVFNTRSGVGKLDGSLGPLLVLFLGTLFFYILIYKKIPPLDSHIAVFFWVSVSLFALANIMMLKLFEPSRYMLFTFPLGLILLISQMFAEISAKFPQKILALIFYVAFVSIVFFLFPIQHKYRTINDSSLFQFLAALPQESLIAGDPVTMDEVPLFSRRKVYLNYESSIPYFRKYNEIIQRRTFRLLAAYYSRSFDEFLRFAQQNNIDYFVVRKQDFLEFYLSKSRSYIQPYHSYIEHLVERGGPFALRNVPDDYVTYEDQHYIVIETKKEKINGAV